MKLFILFLATIGLVAAQHSATLTWVDTQNPSGTTYNLYRISGSCPTTLLTSSTTPPLAPLSSGIAPKTYTDLAVTAGTSYCYYGTAVSGGAESGPSSTTVATIPSNFPPTTFTVVVK